MKKLLLVSLLLLCFLAAGCGESKNSANSAEGGAFLTLTDDAGRKVVLAKKPERIVSLSPSFLEPLRAAGAELVARPSSKNSVPDFAKALPEIGATTSINVERVAELKPDLVIGYLGVHDKLVKVLEENNIPVIIIKMKTYDEVIEKMSLFGKLAGDTEKADGEIKKMQDSIKNLKAKLPQEKKRIAILHGTAKSVDVLLDGSIAGSTAKLLGLENIAANERAVNKAQDAVPFSLERLVEANPDMIFIVTMGSLDEIKKRMNEDFMANPAWKSLAAVQNGRVHYLPQELFLLSPCLEYPSAAECMARLAYAEAF
jgi:iron complex transport system substrate-binding protein